MPSYSAFDIAVVDQIVDNRLRLVDRDGETDAFKSGINNFGGVDTDHLSILVDQRAAGVAGVDGRGRSGCS